MNQRVDPCLIVEVLRVQLLDANPPPLLGIDSQRFLRIQTTESTAAAAELLGGVPRQVRSGEVLFDALALMTSNRPLEDWGKLIGDMPSATATRGKRLVVLVGTKKALAMAVKRADTRQRHTTLRNRLQEAQGLLKA